jgi:hypothetical protein
MAPKDGMMLWIITSVGSSSTELVHFSADGAIACAFLHTHALGLVCNFLKEYAVYCKFSPDVIFHFVFYPFS